MNEDLLTYKESYLVMLAFLQKNYELTNSEDLAILLGGFNYYSIKEDKLETMDPAAWEDWIDSIKLIKQK